MNIFRGNTHPFSPADVNSFVGPARTKLLASSENTTPVHVYHVVFEQKARTNWHTHSGPQWLIITEGSIRVQREGEPAQDVTVGDAVLFAPGERHWHGAAPGQRGVHIAINVNAKTTWLEKVSEAEYES